MTLPITRMDATTDVVPPRRILIYGDSGCGKTRLIGSAQKVPELADVLVLDLDKGTATLAGTAVSAVPARTAQDVESVLWLLKQGHPSVAQFKTVVLDGCSELHKRDLSEQAARATAKDADKRPDQDKNEVQDWGVSNNRLVRLIRMARDLPVPLVIFTAWAKKTFPKIPGTKQADKTAQPTQIEPDFADGLNKYMRGLSDDVWYLYHDPSSDKRFLVTNNYGTVTAKTRSSDEISFAKKLTTLKDGKTLPYIEEPNFSAIWTLYKEALQGTK
jgi:hypothetical protein